MLLTQTEIAELTGYRRKSNQVRELRRLGIPVRVRHDGRPIVVESDLPVSEKHKREQPNFDAL